MINREAIETHLAGLASHARPADGVDIDLFLRKSADLFSQHFDEHGWPDEMPAFTLLPANKEGDGYAGYVAGIFSALWCWPRNGDSFEVEKNALLAGAATMFAKRKT